MHPEPNWLGFVIANIVGLALLIPLYRWALRNRNKP